MNLQLDLGIDEMQLFLKALMVLNGIKQLQCPSCTAKINLQFDEVSIRDLKNLLEKVAIAAAKAGFGSLKEVRGRHR